MHKMVSILLCILLLTGMLGCDIVNNVKDNTDLDKIGQDIKDAGKVAIDGLKKLEEFFGEVDTEKLMEDIKGTVELLNQVSTSLPIRDPAIEQNRKAEYEQLLLWFDGMTKGIKPVEQGETLTSVLVKVDDVTADHQKDGEDACYFHIYYAVVEGGLQGGKIYSQHAESLTKGIVVKMIKADGQWSVQDVVN